jgi:ABC-type antimicrobial peptide transport system permease subunit
VFSGDTFFVVRTAGPPEALAPLVADAVRRVDTNQSLFDIRPMTDRLVAASWQARVSVSVLTALALIGLVVAAVGTYGVLACAVSLREREFGVRAALGADARGLRRVVLLEGLRPVAAGLAVGLAATVGAGRWLRAVLFEVAPADPVVLGASAVGLGAAALVACLAPAWRAARTDPAVALRAD